MNTALQPPTYKEQPANKKTAEDKLNTAIWEKHAKISLPLDIVGAEKKALRIHGESLVSAT